MPESLPQLSIAEIIATDERPIKSLTIGKLAAALAAAQGEMLGAAKDSQNPHLRTRYADLAAVWDACRAPLSKHGLAVTQLLTRRGADVIVTSMLIHAESGEYIGSALPMAAMRQLQGGGWEALNPAPPQVVGSTATYARRYGLSALVGVAPDDDDDAESASGRPAQAPQRRAPAPAKPAAPAPPVSEAGSTNVTPKRTPEAAFAPLQARVGDRDYYYILSTHNVSPSLVGDRANLKAAYDVLQARVAEMDAADAEKNQVPA